ncbi:hypothetical protein OIE67_16775 [Nonomuraea fuscirosea]|uniref:hypothetical protein n=1 Tax=Nonomuraea fuscirosea TaxID=1291556 RepID=UPI002DD89C31|nr:hypothetical protein [Nonomuraea fuscirosea]WSA56192.1 hypothetical protein OIE67_16775 [Nonomuraea fuscirosea]
MRLRLVDHAYMAPIENGLHIVTPAGPVTLTGASIARWVEALVPHLDGRFSLAEITAGLPAAHAELARSILTRLREAGVVREIPAGTDADGRDEESVAGPALGGGDEVPGGGFAGEVAFVAAHVEGARAAFDRFRELKVAVACDDPAEEPLAEAIAAFLRASGAAHVRVGGAGELGEEELWSLDALLLTSALGPASAKGRSRGGSRAPVARDGLAVGYVLREGTDIWYVPVRAAKEDPLATVRPESLRARLRRAPRVPEPITDLHVEAAAAQVGRAVLRWATGTADPRHAGRLTRIGPGLVTSRHHCPPHPYELPAAAPTPEAVLSRVEHLRSLPAEDGPAFSDAAIRAADELFGPFRYLPDDSAAQSPLHVSEAEVGDAHAAGLAAGSGSEHTSGPRSERASGFGTGGDGRATVVRAVGFDYADTRIEAARAALARYAAATVDPRRLVDSGGVPLAAEDADPADLHAVLAAGVPGGFAFAYDLAAAAIVRLPAERAFPRLPTGAAAQMPGQGEGYGPSWDEAVTRGLCSHWTCDPELIEDRAGRPATVDPAGLDETGRRCFALLAELGELPEVRDHGGRFGVTVLSFHHDGTEVARTAGTASSAWTRGLLDTLFAVQTRIHAGHPRPREDDPRPATLAASMTRLDPGQSIDPDEVAAALAVTGRRAVVLPLDHDPAVAVIAPLSLRVAITDPR